jgi:hypothetical protein
MAGSRRWISGDVLRCGAIVRDRFGQIVRTANGFPGRWRPTGWREDAKKPAGWCLTG